PAEVREGVTFHLMDTMDEVRAPRIVVRRRIEQCKGKHFVHRIHQVERDTLAHLGRQLLQVALVHTRYGYMLHALAVRRHQLLPQSANAEYPSAEREFTGHGYVSANRPAGKSTHDCRANGNTGTRPVLGCCSCRDMKMQVLIPVKLGA